MKDIPSVVLRTGVSILAALVLSLTPGLTIPVQAAPAAQASKKVDVNNADEKTLETLPGIGPALAQRIIDNRPYKKLADLEKVPGLSKTKVDALKGQVSFGKTTATKTGKETAATKPAKEPQTGKTTTSGKETATPAPTGRINVNTADAKTLETLPGIGSTLAQRIIENRPYKSLADLEKVKGLSKTKAESLKDQITFGPTTTTRTGRTTTPKESPSTDTTESKGKAPQVNGTETPTSPTGRTAEQLAPGEKINLNTATADQLDKLYGIGPVKAQAIIEYRQEHGGFKSIEEIKNVKGIKEGEYEKIKDHISVR